VVEVRTNILRFGGGQDHPNGWSSITMSGFIPVLVGARHGMRQGENYQDAERRRAKFHCFVHVYSPPKSRPLTRSTTNAVVQSLATTANVVLGLLLIAIPPEICAPSTAQAGFFSQSISMVDRRAVWL
jgi:hypothetical protein